MSHSTAPPQPIRIRSTCDVCLEAKVRCSRDRPACRRCLHHGRDCVYSNKRRLGRPRGTTSRSRTASQSTDIGTYTTLSMDGTARLMNAASAGSSISDNPPDQASDSISLYTQQDMIFNAEGQSEYPFCPMWATGFGNDQVNSGTSGHDSSTSTQNDPRLHHNQHQHQHQHQHQIFETAYVGLDSSSLGMWTRPQSLVTSTNTTGQVDYVRSSLELPHDTDHEFSTMLLRPVYNTLHNGQRVLLPVMSTGYTSTDDSAPVANLPSSPCCSCYSDILQRLTELKHNNSGVSTSELDQILRLEMDIRIQILAMVRCESCLFERPRTLLLVGVVLESVLDLLECVCVAGGTMEVNERVSRPSIDMRTSRSDSGSGISADQSYQVSPLSTSLPRSQYGICSVERATLLRQLVRTRLHEVLGLTQHLHAHVQSCRTWTSNFKAADTTMAEIGNRVCALMSRLED